MTTLDGVQERIHVRFDGNTYDFVVEDLDLSDDPQDSEILTVITNTLSAQLDQVVSLDGFEVERYPENGLYDIHPQAKFGQ